MINPKQVKILEYLANFKFLSRSQLARLGVEFYNSNYSTHTKALLEAKHIGVMDARNYNLGHIYYLKEKGARVIAEHLQTKIETLNFVKSEPSLSPQTLYHRSYAIDCQIEMTLTCKKYEVEIDFYDREIETLGSIKKNKNLERKTRVPINDGFLEPDAIFRINTSKGKKLYTLELENKDYTKKSFQKILNHIQAFSTKSVSKKYKHEKAWRNLFIYVNSSTMKSIIEKASKIDGIKNWFLFKSFEEVKTETALTKGKFSIGKETDFFTNWKNASNESVDLF